VGVAWERTMCQHFIIESLAWLGEWQELRRRLSGNLVEAEQRGDRYAVTFLRARPAALDRIIQDDPGGAIEETRRALAGWAVETYDLPHQYAFFSAHQARLYAGDVDEAWELIERSLPEIKKSFLLFAHVIRVEVGQLRGRVALAMATRHPTLRYLDVAAQEARKLEKEKLPWSTALALLIHAGVEAGRGRHDAAVARLAAAELQLEASHFRMYAAAAARARGTLIGGDDGRRLISSADGFMTSQRVVNPARMTRMLAPGPWN
jgi:hypothetical protein